MILNKWDYDTRGYKPYEVPDEWEFILYTTDMDRLTTCPHCGKEIRFGDTYTSLEIHTHMGFGYPVCPKCNEKEWERRKEYERNIIQRQG